MPDTIKNIKVPYPIEGVIRSAQLNDTVVPENSVQIAVNMNFDRVGAIQTRPGVATFATSLGTSAKAFGTLAIQSTGVRRLFAQRANGDILVWNGAIWTVVRTPIGNTHIPRFSQFLDYVWMCNGNVAYGDPIRTSNGGVFGGTLVPAGFPAGDFISAGFEGRVWVADNATDTVYFTDIVQFDPITLTYSLTYDVNNYIKNFSPQDGESITGLFRVPRALLVFKQNHIYRIYGAYSVDPYPAYNVGTYSQESIIQAKDGVYFHHSSGFYKFTYDSQPTEISRRVIDFVKAIPLSAYGNVKGVYDGFDAVEWAVGAVTVEGVTYSNCMMRYTISTQVWTIYDYKDHTTTALVAYDDGTNLNILMGTSAGLIGKLNSGTTDFGEPIYYETIDRFRSYTDMWAHAKNVSGVMVMAQNAAGAMLQYQTDKALPNVWTDIDSLTEDYCSLFPNASTDDFNVCRFRLKGYTSGEPLVFYGIELLSIQNKGLNKN